MSKNFRTLLGSPCLIPERINFVARPYRTVRSGGVRSDTAPANLSASGG